MTPTVAPALLAGATVSALIVVLLVAVAGAHAARGRREARDDRRRRELTPLVHALLDDDPDPAVPAPDVVDAPAELDEVVLQLLPQLRGSDREVLRAVLAERGVVHRAVTDLDARRSWRRGRAVTLLGAAAGTSHVAAMAELLHDRSADVRCAAARALGKAGDPAAVGYLLPAAAGPDALPHGVVGMALLDLGTTALPLLRDALVRRGPGGPGPGGRDPGRARRRRRDPDARDPAARPGGGPRRARCGGRRARPHRLPHLPNRSPVRSPTPPIRGCSGSAPRPWAASATRSPRSPAGRHGLARGGGQLGLRRRPRSPRRRGPQLAGGGRRRSRCRRRRGPCRARRPGRRDAPAAGGHPMRELLGDVVLSASWTVLGYTLLLDLSMLCLVAAGARRVAESAPLARRRGARGAVRQPTDAGRLAADPGPRRGGRDPRHAPGSARAALPRVRGGPRRRRIDRPHVRPRRAGLRADRGRPPAAPADLAVDGEVLSVHRATTGDPLTVIRKTSVGRRSDALNAALNIARHPLVCMVDADSLLDQDALLRWRHRSSRTRRGSPRRAA